MYNSVCKKLWSVCICKKSKVVSLTAGSAVRRPRQCDGSGRIAVSASTSQSVLGTQPVWASRWEISLLFFLLHICSFWYFHETQIQIQKPENKCQFWAPTPSGPQGGSNPLVFGGCKINANAFQNLSMDKIEWNFPPTPSGLKLAVGDPSYCQIGKVVPSKKNQISQFWPLTQVRRPGGFKLWDMFGKYIRTNLNYYKDSCSVNINPG